MGTASKVDWIRRQLEAHAPERGLKRAKLVAGARAILEVAQAARRGGPMSVFGLALDPDESVEVVQALGNEIKAAVGAWQSAIEESFPGPVSRAIELQLSRATGYPLVLPPNRFADVAPDHRRADEALDTLRRVIANPDAVTAAHRAEGHIKPDEYAYAIAGRPDPLGRAVDEEDYILAFERPWPVVLRKLLATYNGLTVDVMSVRPLAGMISWASGLRMNRRQVLWASRFGNRFGARRDVLRGRTWVLGAIPDLGMLVLSVPPGRPSGGVYWVDERFDVWSRLRSKVADDLESFLFALANHGLCLAQVLRASRVDGWR